MGEYRRGFVGWGLWKGVCGMGFYIGEDLLWWGFTDGSHLYILTKHCKKIGGLTALSPTAMCSCGAKIQLARQKCHIL